MNWIPILVFLGLIVFTWIMAKVLPNPFEGDKELLEWGRKRDLERLNKNRKRCNKKS